MKRRLVLSILACTIFFLKATLESAPIDPASGDVRPTGGLNGYTLAWSDEFNTSALDLEKWGYRTDSKMWSTQLPANVSVADGLLHLTLKKEEAGGKSYTGAGIVSHAIFRYGYYEARLKTTGSIGWHTSFWTIPYEGFSQRVPGEGMQELDIMENNSVKPLTYSVNTQSWLEPHQEISSKFTSTPNLSADFHVFGCEFTATQVNYYFDGVKVQSVDATLFKHGDQNILLTAIASPLGGAAAVDDRQLPSSSVVDYVRFFKAANER